MALASSLATSSGETLIGGGLGDNADDDDNEAAGQGEREGTRSSAAGSERASAMRAFKCDSAGRSAILLLLMLLLLLLLGVVDEKVVVDMGYYQRSLRRRLPSPAIICVSIICMMYVVVLFQRFFLLFAVVIGVNRRIWVLPLLVRVMLSQGISR